MSVSLASLTSSLSYGGRPTTPPVEYRPDVDGLRAIAVLSVVGFHAAPELLPGGFVGVDIFFVISGFLISGIILRALTRGSFRCLDFYGRRVRRIFPALIIVMPAVWACGWLMLLPDEYALLGKHMTGGAGFVLNFILSGDTNGYFDVWITRRQPLIHLWSLGVEEQFYLLWPLFLLATQKSIQGQFIWILLVSTASFALNVAGIFSHPQASFYLPWSRLWELSIGGALAHAQLHATTRPDGIRATLAAKSIPYVNLSNRDARGIIGATLLLTSFAFLNGKMLFPGWWALAPSIGASLLISAGPQSWINRCVLAQPLMAAIGLMSYPLYLWHWPVLALAHIVEWGRFTPAIAGAAVITALMLAFLTYKYIELPLRSSPNTVRIATTLCLAMVAFGSVGYLTFTQSIPARLESYDVRRFLRASTEDWLPARGFLTLGNGPERVLFLGDSNMEQYYPRIAKVLSDHPLNTHRAVFAVRYGCAPAFEMALADPAACRKFVEDAVKYAKDPGVETIVIGAAWYMYFVAFRDWEHFGEAGPLRPGGDRALDGLKRMIADFISKGKRVYIVLQIPIGARLDPRQMIRRTVLPPGFKVDIRSPVRAEIVKVIDPIVSKLLQITQDTGAIAIDPMNSLCDTITCPAVTPSGEPMYRDFAHLRQSYVRDNVRFLDETVLDADEDSKRDAGNLHASR